MCSTGPELPLSWPKAQACTEGESSSFHIPDETDFTSVEGSQLSRSDKRLWKRIWWTLYSRDRSVAVALGRPVAIDPEDSDVEMISEDDFIDDETDRPAEHSPDPVHVQFFINYVKLSEIMGLVLSQQYSVASKYRRANAIDLTHSDMALADWLQHCPPEVQWDRTRHHFWAALLHANYYTTLCLLHRAHMPPAGSPKANNLDGFGEEHAYPSRNIAYQAAAMITSIIEVIAVQGRNPLLLSAYTAGTLQGWIACRQSRNSHLPSCQRRQYGFRRAQLHGAASAAASTVTAGSATQQRRIVGPRACPQTRPEMRW